MLPKNRLVYLLQEESLHSLLISEVRKLRPGAAAPGSVGGLALLPQLPLEVRVTSPLSESVHEDNKRLIDKMWRSPVKINAVS